MSESADDVGDLARLCKEVAARGIGVGRRGAGMAAVGGGGMM